MTTFGLSNKNLLPSEKTPIEVHKTKFKWAL